MTKKIKDELEEKALDRRKFLAAGLGLVGLSALGGKKLLSSGLKMGEGPVGASPRLTSVHGATLSGAGHVP
ncbi:MAG: hypothetical protein QHH43_10665, partial [Candidatus Saccharicenans sp.]|nr:hypothetical protein [Candidatus Saccharicenans sp.]